MFERFVKWWKARQLQKAREDYAFWKAKRESLESHKHQLSEFEQMMGENSYHREQKALAAANEAKYMERVEILIRQQ